MICSSRSIEYSIVRQPMPDWRALLYRIAVLSVLCLIILGSHSRVDKVPVMPCHPPYHCPLHCHIGFREWIMECPTTAISRQEVDTAGKNWKYYQAVSSEGRDPRVPVVLNYMHIPGHTYTLRDRLAPLAQPRRYKGNHWIDSKCHTMDSISRRTVDKKLPAQLWH